MSWFDQQGIPGYGGNTGVAGGRTRVVSGGPAAPAPAAPAAPSGPASVGHNGTYNGMNREQWRDAWQGLGNMTPQAADAWLSAHGAAQAGGKGDRWTTPFGETLDLQEGRGGANDHGGTIRPIWGAGPAKPAMPAGGNNVPLGSMGQAAGGLAVGQSGHVGGHVDPFQYEKFVAPDVSEIDKDPYYQSRLQRGLGAVQASAASKGMLGDFKTLKALNDYAGTSASDEYQNIYNRAYQTNQANNSGRLGAFTANTNADLGFGNLDLGYTKAGQDYSLGMGNLALGNKQADNSYALGQGNLGLNWANYGLNADQQQFGQGFSLAQLGLQAAGQAGAYGGQYAQNGGSLITGAGNARAAGYAGSGAAYGGALSNLGSTAMGYGMYRGMNSAGGGGGMPGIHTNVYVPGQ